MKSKRDLLHWLADKENRFGAEKWFWRFMTVVVLVVVVFLPHIWTTVSIVYLAIVSNYALDLTAAGAQQGAKAAKEAIKAQPGTDGESDSESS